MGWAIGFDDEPISLEIRVDGNLIDTQITRLARADVARVYPHSQGPAGFLATVDWTPYENGAHRLQCVARNRSRRTLLGQVDVEVCNGEADAFYARVYTKLDEARARDKRETVLAVLACPTCKKTLDDRGANLSCPKCLAQYPLMEGTPVMAGSQPQYPIEESSLRSPPSSYQYPDRVLLELEKTIRKGGLALDVGSGRRSFGADRLIQVEICKYPFTDVVNQSEELPFADEAFDLSFSIAVTEHVERPWRLATEIQRVTKPGGEIIVDAAFLQPLHGYPSHFFNMTRSALESLFRDTEVLSLEAAPYQHPWFSIRWILSALLAELEPGSRSMLGAMTIDQLVAEASRFCEGQRTDLRDVVLPVSKVDELAAGFTIHCRKRTA